MLDSLGQHLLLCCPEIRNTPHARWLEVYFFLFVRYQFSDLSVLNNSCEIVISLNFFVQAVEQSIRTSVAYVESTLDLCCSEFWILAIYFLGNFEELIVFCFVYLGQVDDIAWLTGFFEDECTLILDSYFEFLGHSYLSFRLRLLVTLEFLGFRAWFF